MVIDDVQLPPMLRRLTLFSAITVVALGIIGSIGVSFAIYYAVERYCVAQGIVVPIAFKASWNLTLVLFPLLSLVLSSVVIRRLYARAARAVDVPESPAIALPSGAGTHASIGVRAIDEVERERRRQ